MLVSQGDRTLTPTEKQKKLNRVLRDIRGFYMEIYPKIRRIKQLRIVDGNPDKRERIKREVRSRMDDRIPTFRKRLDELRTSFRASGKISKVNDELLSYFIRYVDRFLNDWSPENPDAVERMSDHEKLKNGVASPELLRRMFLARSSKFLSQSPAGMKDIRDRLRELEQKLSPMYWKLVRKLTDLVKRVKQARKKTEEKEKKTNENKTDRSKNEEEPAGAKGSNEKNEASEPDPDPEVQAVIRETSAEWQSFLEEQRNELDGNLTELNRVLSLFRNREYLYPSEKTLRDRALSLKRRLGELEKRQGRENPFSSREKTREELIKHGIIILRSHGDFMNLAGWPSRAYERLSEKTILKQLDADSYRNYVKEIRMYGKHKPSAKKNEFLEKCERIDTGVKPIAEWLLAEEKNGNERARTIGTLLDRLRSLTSTTKKRLSQDMEARQFFYQTFLNMSYSGSKKFRKKLAKRLERKKVELYGDTDAPPKPSGQQLMRKARELEREIKRELKRIEE